MPSLPRRQSSWGRFVSYLKTGIDETTFADHSNVVSTAPQKAANFGSSKSAESAHMGRFLARQCELRSARMAAQWWGSVVLIPAALMSRVVMGHGVCL